LKKRYGDRVEFLAVYVREAHPTDGWREPSNDKAGIAIAQPRTPGEREAVASTCSLKLKISMPLLVDGLDDKVGHLYSGMPDRLYLIDRNGRVAYQGGRGPWGYKPGELEHEIIMLQLDEAGTKDSGRVPLSSDADAWARLPAVEEKPTQALPVWARACAESLPQTTAAMLELDYLHRARSPLEPKLRAKARWVAAHANGSSYGEAYALADLRRAGATAAEVALLTGDPRSWPAEERTELTFAHNLTREAYTVRDEEVAALKARQGEAKLVALVQLLAYANFQDRLLLALGLQVEKGGPYPPLAVRFRKPFAGAAAPPPRSLAADRPIRGGERVEDAEWARFDFASLKQKMQGQQERLPRIAVPPFDAVRKYMPPTYPKDRELKIKWSLVCLGYQPELASAWSLCTRSFAKEAKQDRVFEESLFWVVTRSQQCFY
jgi:alkylhydroperoxidase family enzyme